jgi:methylthioribose-1-phosphate isomerase
MAPSLANARVGSATVRTVDWADGAVVIIDQTALPATERVLRLSTVEEVVDAIVRLAVRGAPAIGVAGALGWRWPPTCTRTTRPGWRRR